MAILPFCLCLLVSMGHRPIKVAEIWEKTSTIQEIDESYKPRLEFVTFRRQHSSAGTALRFRRSRLFEV